MKKILFLALLLFLLLMPESRAAYSPPGWGLDAWFIREKGVWHQFQLAGPLSPATEAWAELKQPERPPLGWPEQGIYHSTSRDLVTWKDEGVVLTVAKPGEWDDGRIFTGNIAKHGDTFYLFYTGILEKPKAGVPNSLIGVATSKDLKSWTKHPRNPILLPDARFYDVLGNWRDCSFYWDAPSKTWYAVICATAKGEGPMDNRACIGLAKSPDLLNWECLPPLVISPRYTLGLENPFLFTQGGKWYAGHSMYSHFLSKAWMEKNPAFPVRGGAFDDALGAQLDPPPYAVQIVPNSNNSSDRTLSGFVPIGTERLFLHRGPQRWATALPKKIAFSPQGKMCLMYWNGTEKARRESLLFDDKKTVMLDAARAVDLGKPLRDCFFEGAVSTSERGAVGFALGDALLIEVEASPRFQH